MKEILQAIFSEITKDCHPVIIGNSLYLILNDDRRVEICLYDLYVNNHYNTLRLRLIHKNVGEIHNQTIPFSDLFKNPEDKNREKSIWKSSQDSTYNWYGKPEDQDIQAIRDAVMEYVNLWR